MLIVILLVLVLMNGVGYFHSDNSGPRYGYGGLGMVLLILLILMVLHIVPGV